MVELLKNKLENKKILLLGFGREGRSSYHLIRKILPQIPLTVADSDSSVKEVPMVAKDQNVSFILGPGYLDALDQFDLIIKSPGITLKDLPYSISREKMTSQTDLFLQFYSGQVIGITGTKGKSTTSSLLQHVLKRAGKNPILVGNIGQPAFDYIDEILPETPIVFEMSSHQLEYLTISPYISVLLNLFQEHLDAYPSFRDYQLAKMNITLFQQEGDHFIFSADDPLIRGFVNEFKLTRNYLPFSFESELCDGCFVRDSWIFLANECMSEPFLNLEKKRKLKGDHNVRNIMAVVNVCQIMGIDHDIIRESIAGFTGLEHRLEYAGEFQGIHFYNDSIATIPEAAMEAVKALGNVDTIVLGGFDRGIDYSGFAKFLSVSGVRNFIFTGEAGNRIRESFIKVKRDEQKEFLIQKFDEFRDIAMKVTRPGSICLLSPAASSYDEFPNFEIRGKRFKELVRVLLVFLFLVPVFSFSQNTAFDLAVRAYIEAYHQIAEQEMVIYRVPASITLAQGIFESNAGRSKLATEANNHFGIKCHKEWTGDTFIQDDETKNECFRKYENPEESFRDHSYFLTTRDRYKSLFLLDITDYKGWAHGLKQAGYATNPNYAELLIKHIETFQLYKYDVADYSITDIDSMGGVNDTLDPFLEKIIQTEKRLQDLDQHKIYTINGIKLTKAIKGDTWEKIADQFDIAQRKLIKYNDLKKDAKITTGQLIFLEMKRKKGAVSHYVVKKGETMYTISQVNGIQLKFLYKMNGMKAGQPLKAGQTLILR
jgi:UDP-N-acetylmuramoyl-L-alanine---L-glutamate ligase